MFFCVGICVEVNLEKVLLEAINISMEVWNHLQIVDYEKIPFKCKVCHEYRHFTRFCAKRMKNVAEEHSGE